MNGEPLSPIQKRGHVTLLIMAGADVRTMHFHSANLGGHPGRRGGHLQLIAALDNCNFLWARPSDSLSLILRRLPRLGPRSQPAEDAGHLSLPTQYEETRAHLPYVVACIKESLRLQPPAPNLFARVSPPNGKALEDGTWIPAGVDGYEQFVRRAAGSGTLRARRGGVPPGAMA